MVDLRILVETLHTILKLFRGSNGCRILLGLIPLVGRTLNAR